MSSVPPRNLHLGFEAQTLKPATDGFETQTTKPAREERTPYASPAARHVSPPSSTGQPPKSSEPRSTCTSSVLTRSTRSLPCTLAPADVPDVSHRSWLPGLLVPQSKPHVRPSPLPVRRYGTSLLDLHLAINHRLRASHLHTTSQETCRTTQLTP
jgi:hypothetical protein